MQTKHASFTADWLSVGEVAQLVGVSADTVRRWEKAGRITANRTPTGHRRFRRSDVDALLTGDAGDAL